MLVKFKSLPGYDVVWIGTQLPRFGESCHLHIHCSRERFWYPETCSEVGGIRLLRKVGNYS